MQKFIRSNSWIFPTLFAQLIILIKEEVYVGGKNIENSDGKFTDFLLKNKLSNNCSFLEIKTHLTDLLEPRPYRGKTIFAASKELTVCLNQVLSQRDVFQKEFYILKGKENKPTMETFNSRCTVLIGQVKNLTTEQKNSFELFRSNS